MKKSGILLVVFILLIGLSVLTNAQDGSDIKTKSFNVKKGGTLYVNLTEGDVKISTWDKNEVYIKIKSDDRKKISGISLTLEDNTVKISNRDGGGWGWSGDITVNVSIPSEFNVEVNTQSGDVSQTGNLKGTATVFTAGGDIRLQGVTGKTVLKSNGGDITTGNIGDDLLLSTNGGDVNTGYVSGITNIKTMGGDITVTTASKDLIVTTMGGDINIGNVGGKAEVKTMGGSISVKKISGDAIIDTYGGDISLSGATGNIEATTYGGNIRMSNISGAVNLDTKSGDIYLELNPSENNNSKIRTMNGGVRIYLPSNTKATINATVSGRNYNEYRDRKPGNTIRSDFEAKSFTSNDRRDKIEAKYILNGGGKTITIISFNGNIEIRKK